jgi:hypothetical protein
MTGFGFRVFIAAYAAVLLAITIAVYTQEPSHGYYAELWWSLGAVSLSYLVMATGYWFSRQPERLSSLALVFVFGLSGSLLGVAALAGWPFDVDGFMLLTFVGSAILIYLTVAVVLLQVLPSRPPASTGKLQRRLISGLLLVGAAMVLSSVFSRIANLGVGRGWDVVTRRASWVTSGFNVASGLFGPTIEWLQGFYAYAGFVVYLLTLASTVAVLALLVRNRFSSVCFHESTFGLSLSVIVNLCGLSLLNDIFWGWHFDLSNIAWTAVTGTVLWLVMPMYATWLLAPAIWGKREPWRLKAFLVLQVPIAAFNFLMLPAYFGEQNLGIPGLGILIMGVQLESWACLMLLIPAARDARVYEIVAELRAEAA